MRCKTGCGFFAADATSGYCSRCFREFGASAASASASAAAAAAAAVELPSSSEAAAVAAAAADVTAVADVVPAVHRGGAAERPATSPQRFRVRLITRTNVDVVSCVARSLTISAQHSASIWMRTMFYLCVCECVDARACVLSWGCAASSTRFLRRCAPTTTPGIASAATRNALVSGATADA